MKIIWWIYCLVFLLSGCEFKDNHGNIYKKNNISNISFSLNSENKSENKNQEGHKNFCSVTIKDKLDHKNIKFISRDPALRVNPHEKKPLRDAMLSFYAIHGNHSIMNMKNSQELGLLFRQREEFEKKCKEIAKNEPIPAERIRKCKSLKSTVITGRSLVLTGTE